MPYRIEVRDDALADLEALPANLRQRMTKAMESRLGLDPARYGIRLRRDLRGLWKLRVGDYRIAYEIEGQVVRVWAILHRKLVYPEVGRRIGG